MNPENQDFANLRRLLKLKRYEQPPPRYFNDFSSQVIARLQAGEAKGAESLSQAAWEAPWLQRFLEYFERKPILAGVFGAAVCGLLVGAALYSEVGDAPVAELEQLKPAVNTQNSALAFGQTPPASLNTNPVSLFDLINSQAQPAQNVIGRPLGQ